MAIDNTQSQDADLERTDRLPILAGVVVADDVEDDAVRLDHTVILPALKSEFPRPPAVDLPSLAESVRSVEERIARQQADYEALSRSYKRVREAEATAVSRSQALAAELADVRAAFEAEQLRTREMEQALADKTAAAEADRARVQEALREAERRQAESLALEEKLTARDATIAQALHSLGERDAQLTALQAEHARIVPALEERSRRGALVEADLRAARARAEVMAGELQSTQQSFAALNAQIHLGKEELEATRRELDLVKSQADVYLETLRTQEWRQGFDQNVVRELDAQIDAAQGGQGVLQSQRDELRARLTALESTLAARDESIAQLKAAAAAGEAQRGKLEQRLHAMDGVRAELSARISALESDAKRLTESLAARDRSIAEFEAARAEDQSRRATLEQRLQALDGGRAELADKIGALESDRDRLTESLAAREQSIAELEAALAAEQARRRQQEQDVEHLKDLRAELTGQIAALQDDQARLHGELQNSTCAAEEALAAARGETQRLNEALAAAGDASAALTDEVRRLETEAANREEEMAVLVAHLHASRRPLRAIEADLTRLTEELAVKTQMLETLTEENRALRLTVERTRGALEEREFLIRRLERSESNNANVLGRIQTSIERLGLPANSPVSGGVSLPSTSLSGAQQALEVSAELTRIDGQHDTAYPLARRTRIGRAPGCELQVESSSVSRHHALVLVGQRDVIIEDLNSTNGVLVNGRKVSRQQLSDGDVLTIGDVQFRLKVTLPPRAVGAAPAAP